MMKKPFLIFLVFFIPFFSFCQEQPDNVLKRIVSNVRNQPDSALLVLPRYFSHPNDSIKATAYLCMGNAWYFKSKYDSAIAMFSIAADYFQQQADDKSLSKAYNGIGLGYYFLSNYEKSFEFHKKALETRKRSGDAQISSTYNNLGLVLTELGSKAEALMYYKLALNSKIDNKQFSGLSTTLTNIASIYRSQNELDSAMYYDLKNLEHLDSIPDDRNLATCINNLSITYLNLGNYKQAEYYSLRALVLEKRLQRSFEIVNVCKNISIIYEKKKQFGLADKYLDSVFLLVKDAQEFRPVVGIYLQQARVDSLKGNFTAAYFHLQNYISIKNTFDERERKDLVLDLEQKYQTEIKEKQITELQQTNTIKDLAAAAAQQRQAFLLLGLFLLIVLVFVVYKRYQLKQRLAKELDGKNTELEKLNSFKDRMFAVISHDLRNPVHAFSTLMESLHQNAQHASKEELQEFLQSTLQAARDLQSLLNNLLEWALVQIGRLPFQPTTISLKAVVNESMHHTELMALQKGITISSTVQHETAFADQSMLVIVVRNLLTNAIKFSNEGKTVEIHVTQHVNSAQLIVRDNGPGMQAEEVARLFKQNEGTRNIGQSSEKGIGIGLLLCHELMQKNNGKIWVESTPGVGSTFYLELPVA